MYKNDCGSDYFTNLADFRPKAQFCAYDGMLERGKSYIESGLVSKSQLS
jgi:hypothetical protein